jgi:hypothetical protein
MNLGKLNKMVSYKERISWGYTNSSSNQAPQGCKNLTGKEQMLCCLHSPAASHTIAGVVSNNVSSHQIVFSR